jgi:hypothetical protein
LQKAIGKTKNARVEVAEALNPLDLIKMHQVLTSSNSLHDLMIWTMFILQVKLFLRVDELIRLKFSKNFIPTDIEAASASAVSLALDCSDDGESDDENDNTSVHDIGSSRNGSIDTNTYLIIEADLANYNHLVEELCIFTDAGEVKQLCFFVKGKTDNVGVHLLVHADNEIPQLCPIRALMMYLHVSGIRSGFLFPHDGIISNLQTNHQTEDEAGSHGFKRYSYGNVQK